MVRLVGMGKKPENVAKADPRSGWEAYLDNDEHILWEGRPNSGLRFRASDIVQSFFGLFFLGIAIFWMSQASMMNGGFGSNDNLMAFFPLFGLPFVAVGIYLVIGKYFWKSFVRARTRYALSNKRAFIAKRGLVKRLRSWPITSEQQLDYRPGDESTIYFAKNNHGTSSGLIKLSFSNLSGGRRSRRVTVLHGFEYINDGAEVYRLMRNIISDEV